MTVTRIVLIRHGEAQSHVEGRVGGRTGCTGLSELGRRQASALRDRLAGSGELAGVARLYSSTLPRAHETAQIIAPAIGLDDVVQVDDLREFDAGPNADGLTWEEFGRRYPQPDVWTPFHHQTPGAETWAEFGARVGRALDRIAREHRGETVAVACHGGVIEHSFTVFHHRTISGTLTGGIAIENCGITEWQHEESPEVPWIRPGVWTLVRHNDHSHVPSVERRG